MHWLHKALTVTVVFLTGCATQLPQTEGWAVPPEAMADCPEPSVDVTTNRGLAQGVRDLRTSLRLCNKDKAAIREALGPKIGSQ